MYTHGYCRVSAFVDWGSQDLSRSKAADKAAIARLGKAARGLEYDCVITVCSDATPSLGYKLLAA